ncbi:MAG: protein kinase [Verrucomicrobiales bacterium]|nr:protein kinase [Verrucomicrobiales bacterium]MDP4940191.1 protein kinase [Verrucomicrobiales bacterium]MDP5006814.1 protein kinase [Verrucomicrobiales bacterium]
MHEEDSIKVKDYVIHQPALGEGAYGQVFRATYRGISERALKIFRPGAVDLATMARELEKLSQVTEHQGIVTLHDFDLLHDPPYYAMGLHAYQNLDGFWETRTLERLCGHVDHREGWRLIRDIADAVSYLHRNQIIHCDIKPSNILLTDETPFHIKICDFGQSRGQAAEGFQPVGTPLYASPEQLRNPRDSADGKGFRWDVYSFGVVAYKLLTGELPRLQGLANAERRSFDPDSTLVEATIEGDQPRNEKVVTGRQLATLIEAVEDITWPSGFYIPSDRKLLVEQCLSLDSRERPADMREVWGRIEQLDQQTVVKRARRLNTIFAILLVVALWASGFAFIQARKAKRATDAAMLASVESDKSAGAAVDLMLLFVSELNKGDISGAGADRLYSIVSENAQTFLDNRSKDRLTSTRILRFSAQTAALRGRQALEREDFDEALKDFTSAYEIRSELAEDPNSPDDFALLASRDLMEIGKIHELKIDYKEAATAYSAALEWRSQVSGESGLFSLAQIKELATNYKALSRVQELGRDTKSAIATLNEILSIVNRRIEDGAPSDVPGYALEAARVLLLRGAIEYSSGNITEASTTYQSLMTLVKSLSTAPPSLAEEARGAHLEALRSLGLIQLDQKQPEAALVLFREEIKIREEATRLRPYDAEAKVSLADAYAYAAQSLDLTNATSRSLATFYLEQAVALVDKLPTDIKTRSDINVKLTRFKSSLSEIMGM